MIQDKEYPATHSMSTAWYVADEEGNVGIFNFDDNGPVPEQAVSESSVNELLFGLESDYTKYKATQINLSDQQLEELLISSHLPEEEKYWWDCVVQIDQSKVTDYLEMVSREGKITNICLSRDKCLFKVDFHKYLDKEQIQNESLLHNLIDKGIITQVFNIKSFWLDEIIDEEEDIDIENIIGHVPYYIYWEPYSTSLPQKRLNKPLHPVKLNQIPAGLREHIPILPVHFADKETLQIAEWTPCYWNCYNMEAVEGFYYDLLPLTDGSKSYLNTNSISSCLYDYCSEKEKYNCDECGNNCYKADKDCFTCDPTLLVIINPFENCNLNEQIKTDLVISHSVWLPFLPKIPLKLKKPENILSDERYLTHPSKEDIRKHINGHKLLVLFQKNRKWLEDWVERFNPRVILISGQAEAVMGTVYPMQDNHIEINGTVYPMYLLSEVENNREEIERLAAMPYQGKQIPRIITMEEMEKIKQGK